MDSADFKLNILLIDISANLGSDELKAMKFLCRDLLSINQLDKADSGLGLFHVLQEQGFLDVSDYFIVAELLYCIKQFRLLNRMKYNKQQVCNELKNLGKARVTSYRQLLFEVSEDITMKDLEIVKHFLHRHFSKSKLENIKTMLDALVEMEKEGLLEKCNTKLLEDICKTLGEELVAKFESYRREERRLDRISVPLLTPTPETSSPGNSDVHFNTVSLPPSLSPELRRSPSPRSLQNSISQLSVSQDNQTLGQGVCITSMMINEGQDKREQDSSDSQDKSIGLVPDLQTLGSYKMESNPRGYCVIINNCTFEKMPERRGTEKDAGRLRQIFTWLGFKVEIKNDLPAAHMQKTMDEYRRKDHRPYDCFVCCILTHGRKGVMCGTDDREVAIREIISYFSASRCPSLQKKPKVFFIQACQGSEKQDGVTVEEDGFIHLLEEDAVRATRFTIPDEADFLLGMATVEGYVSFRHVVEGTWYIQSLCDNLEEYCPSEDLLSILTIVNRDVSEKTVKNFKTQMPQPSYTLRKKLYFPVAKSFADSKNSS
ncbi:caspase-8-like [Amblyraja radiata]|uniref:caspase-8-like n=1 Tax=Amblyraja radiata TaxID=386614 RepID=UPI001402B01B|nr:caspase-8-like [Amblyraja radiata]XP_032880352.1 caspase-8-like [Amblyraja radiata]XP_032880353.1 caspase-8-like [Amblyraja radiata]